jgi:hypothetical protein
MAVATNERLVIKKIQTNDIQIKGARTHNLKNVDVVFPRNKLIVLKCRYRVKIY